MSKRKKSPIRFETFPLESAKPKNRAYPQVFRKLLCMYPVHAQQDL